MTQIYYINAATGSNANVGTISDAPLKSISALNNIVLNRGDTVLLARGTTYFDQLTVKYSGAAGNPITFGAYGQGAAPVINGPSTGVYSSGTHDIVVHDIAIAHTSGYAVFGRNVSNWTVDNVAVTGTGSVAHSGAISFESSSNITVENSVVSGVTGDGLLINGGQGITIKNNQVSTVQGHNGDNVQVSGATNVTITGNQLDMSGPTDSTKGNLVVNSSNGVDIEHNTMIGGSYGASVNSNNVTIAFNEIHDQKGYSWSFGVGIGETWSVKNYNIHDNNIHNVAYGVAVSGTSTSTKVLRVGIDVHNNTFDHIGNAALKVDRAASGDFTGNHVGSDSNPTQISAWIAAQHTFLVSGNDTFNSTPPDAHLDVAQVISNATQVAGDVLINDVSISGATLSVSAVNGHAAAAGLSVAGTYGMVSIDPNGSFVYHVDPAAMVGIDHQVSDIFSYVVTDGHEYSTSTLEVDLAPNSVALQAVGDSATVGADGLASGNALTNDLHDYFATLHVSSVGSSRMDAGGPVVVAGQYGTLNIAANGEFSYAVDAVKVAGNDGMLRDNFTYKMSDGSSQDSASLGFGIDAHALTVQIVPDFHI